MYRFKNRLLPLVFNNFFTEVSEVHRYNTRSAAKQSSYLPEVRTTYGKFNIRFQAPVIWNAINEQVKDWLSFKIIIIIIIITVSVYVLCVSVCVIA